MPMVFMGRLAVLETVFFFAGGGAILPGFIGTILGAKFFLIAI